ncbi:GNAT family N-acetyltransferase [Pseudonocardia sp. KRD291]|uniref:GNAT family N-acetyltransferase n=1 Tax=Pseudonocardia sp. KRD291 TaxID=2792007 RepID=UPI001C49D2A6|nr:GNAT family N-acetyltransferase [Pseudonocardia sp. KRD291]MBW0106101.1 GNAT family N-acetyltransferase [Pseudonocardia sp. KRD291]
MVRAAGPGDVPAIVELVHELAEYEKAREECGLTVAQLHAALFGPDPSAQAHVAVLDGGTGGGIGGGTDGGAGGEVVGCAIFFRTFSTWEGVPGIHLEDLYVRPEHRGSGLGGALLASLAARCRADGYARLEWNVLDWNAPAIGFYRAIGAVPNEGWTTYRLTGAELERMGARDRAGPQLDA